MLLFSDYGSACFEVDATVKIGELRRMKSKWERQSTNLKWTMRETQRFNPLLADGGRSYRPTYDTGTRRSLNKLRFVAHHRLEYSMPWMQDLFHVQPISRPPSGLLDA